MSKIRAINIVGLEGTKQYAVGDTVRNSKGDVCGQITEILDESLEFENGIVREYGIYAGGKRAVARLIQCPVEVIYYG